ncbi:MAG: MarC family protein [Dehalococcoidales bacterium]|nr:MarC family protein [Dehalococcoidales bacterium]
MVWIIFKQSNRITRYLGRGGVLAVSKVSSLLLAAVAVNMVIRGLSMMGVLNIPA